MNKIILQLDDTHNYLSQTSEINTLDILGTLERVANQVINNPQVCELINSVNTRLSLSIHLTIVNSYEIQSINNEYRQINKPTDVLTFPIFEHSDVEASGNQIGSMLGDLLLSYDNTSIPAIPIGDIFICSQVAIEQAIQLNHSYLSELCFLLIHGILHLLGFDHIEDKHASIMIPLQQHLICELNLY